MTITIGTEAPVTAPVQESRPMPQAGGAESAFAVTSFVLGIVSIVGSWTFFAPVIGLVFGILALRRGTAERALALWGVWINAILLAFTALIALGALTVFGIGLAAGIPNWVG